MRRMRRVLLVLAVVCSLLASFPARAQDDVPPWLMDIRARPVPPGPPMDPVGRHFLRHMTPGMVTYALGAGVHVLPLLGALSGSEIGWGFAVGSRPYPVFKNFYSGGLGSVRGFEQGSLGVVDRVQRARRRVLRVTMAVGVTRVLFLQPRGVAQQDGA